ncbi:MFS transporter [Phenylobacterium sp. SCN 70-31]|uniref:MFS transporter n=1 Tax=Phenylobacterium sp. SCN 70-31 TaxID=1660129 RepID=UPI00343859FC
MIAANIRSLRQTGAAMTRGDRREPGAGLTTTQLVAFGFPAMTHALIASPVYAILPTYYAANTNVTLAEIGTIAAASRIIDALNDPLMGYVSDRYGTRFGHRKPWMIGAIVFCALAVFQLFSPPSTATWVYFLVWSQVLYTGFTMFEVPRAAWGAEISRDYQERTRIGVYVGGFNIAGSLSFYLLPIAMGLLIGRSEIDGGTLSAIAWIYVIAMPIGVLTSMAVVPRGDRVEQKRTRFIDVLRTIARSRPAQIFFGITMLWGLGQGVVLSCSFIFYTQYMGLGSFYALIMGALFLTGIIALPVWSRILQRVDRHRAWALCIGLPVLLSPIVLLLPRGEAALIPILCLVVVRGFLSSPANFLPGAVLSDVIDYDTLKSGGNKAGNLFAFQMLLIKIAIATGGAIAFNLLDLADYNVGGENTPAATTGLLLTYMGIPAVFHLSMAVLAWRFPIDRRRQGVIQRRLQQRAARGAQEAIAQG